jgi:hypothetical protein
MSPIEFPVDDRRGRCESGAKFSQYIMGTSDWKHGIVRTMTDIDVCGQLYCL